MGRAGRWSVGFWHSDSTRLLCQHPAFSPLLTPPRFIHFPSPQDELKDEVRDMAKKLGMAGMQLLVIDTGGCGIKRVG